MPYLLYNEYGLDYSFDESKRAAVLNFLESQLSLNVPIQALGIQAHLRADNIDQFDSTSMRTFLANVAQMGLKILITEMDVIDQLLPLEVQLRDQVIADTYKNYLGCVLEEPAVIAVLNWGLSDRYTWLSDFAPRSDGAGVRPLPLDRYMVPKPCAQAIMESFGSATSSRIL